MRNRLIQFLLPTYLKWYKFYTIYLIPYKYIKNRYNDSFVSKNEKKEDVKLENAREIIYIFWTGTNAISKNRMEGIQSLKENAEVEVELITPYNLGPYILKEYPLHPAYEFLSLIQKSDYLRGYFMLHYGGGYCDIKPCINSWKFLFSKLNNSKNKWCIGPREKFVGGVQNIEGNIGIDCKKYHNNLISNGAFVYKPNSPIAIEWMQETHERLDFFMPALIENPGDEFGDNNYPIPWAFIMAYIVHPLLLKYHDKVICTDIDLFSIENYR